MQRYMLELSTGYANFCDAVVAPSESVGEILRERGVTRPIHVVPTGVELELFAAGDDAAMRRRLQLPPDAPVVGHVGRLAPEKNLTFLAEAAAKALQKVHSGRFLVVGSGPSETDIRHAFRAAGVADRLHFAGVCTGSDLADAYHAMDVFAFASKSETQGMVLVEALAAGTPVVAVDAPGAREVVRDGENGRLLDQADVESFAAALAEMMTADKDEAEKLRRRAKQSARPFHRDRSCDAMVGVYEQVRDSQPLAIDPQTSSWPGAMRSIKREWDLWTNRVRSAATALTSENHVRGS